MNEQEYKDLLYILDDNFEKELLFIYWNNGLKIRCRSFTGMYETDTELTPREEGYEGEYAAGVDEVEVLEEGRDSTVEIYNGSIEISLVNIPDKITLEDGTLLWSKDKA